MTGRKTSNWWTFWGVLILLWALFPLLWMVSLSFKEPSDVPSAPTDVPPQHWACGQLQTVFSDTLFTSALRNSVGIALHRHRCCR